MNSFSLANAVMFTTDELAEHTSPLGQDSRTAAWYPPTCVTFTVSVFPETVNGALFSDQV